MNLSLAIIPFGYPTAIWFALIGIPIAIAFFFRFRMRTREVPALAHWLQVGRPMDVRSLGSLLRRFLSLLLMLLLAVLLIAALADPFPTTPDSHRIVLIVDVSSTMQTREGSTTRLGQARTLAQRLLANAPRDAQVILITVADRPQRISLPSDKSTSLSDQLSSLHAVDTDANIISAIHAASFLESDPLSEVHVISDFAGEMPLSSLRAIWKGPARLILHPIGTDHPNAAIIGYWVRARPDGWRIGVSVASRGMATQQIPVELFSDGKLIASTQCTLADQTVTAELFASLPPESPFELRLSAHDDLPVDDIAYGVLPPRMQVTLVTRGNIPLEQALRAQPMLQLRIVSHSRFSDGSPDSIVIVDRPGLRPLSQPHAKGYLFIGTGDPFGRVAMTDVLEKPAVTHWSSDSPVMIDLDPGEIQFYRAHILHPAPAITLHPILSSGATPLIAEANLSNNSLAPQKWVYWPFDIAQTDLPGRFIFPVLLWNTLDYLHGADQTDTLYYTGHHLTLAAGSNPTLTDPDSRPVDIDYDNHRTRNPINRQGIYHYQNDSGNRQIAVNLLSPRGTLLLPRDGVSAAASSHASAAHVLSLWQWFTQTKWAILTLTALFLFIVESLLFHRQMVRIG